VAFAQLLAQLTLCIGLMSLKSKNSRDPKREKPQSCIDISAPLDYNMKAVKKVTLPEIVSHKLPIEEFIMRKKGSPSEEFVKEIAHAFAKYGVRISDASDKNQESLLYLKMKYVLDDNFADIMHMIEKLEFRYP